jgi:purine nucleosidase
MKKRIILDTDVGTDVDDALALALLAASPELQVEGVTTVHADAPLRARIARVLLNLAGREDVPVIAGASRPLQMPIPENFHWGPRLWGHEGVGILPSEDLAARTDQDEDPDAAARFIVGKAAACAGELSLVTIGPLTNIARALRLEPLLAGQVRELVLMGGMIDTSRSDWPPMLETNLNADPGAAQVVFGSEIPLVIVPIEVTTQVYLSPEQRTGMRTWRHPLAETLVVLMEQMQESFSDFSQTLGLTEDIFQGRTYMHDPLAVYVSMTHDLVTLRETHVRLEVRNDVLRTVPYTDRPRNARVCQDVDAPAFVQFWLERVERLAASPKRP